MKKDLADDYSLSKWISNEIGGKRLLQFAGVSVLIFPTLLLFASVSYLFFVPLFCGIVALILSSQWIYSKRALYIGLAISIFGAIAPIGLQAYLSNRSGLPIHFIIPDSFSGEIVLKEKETAPEIPKDEKHYLIKVPKNGIIEFKNLDAFKIWHSKVIKRESGSTVPWPGHVDADTVSWHEGTHSSDGESRFFVGTLREYYSYKGWEERLIKLND